MGGFRGIFGIVLRWWSAAEAAIVPRDVLPTAAGARHGALPAVAGGRHGTLATAAGARHGTLATVEGRPV